MQTASVLSLRSVLTALAGPLLVSACAVAGSPGGAGGSDAAASCAAVLEYDGRTYTGYGDLKYVPATSGVTGTGTMPRCDDQPESQDDVGAEKLTVAELRDIGPDRAVLTNGGVFLADGKAFPEQIRAWFSAPDCDLAGSFGVHGDWLTVDTHAEPRFDGDLRAPYRVTVAVLSTDPRAERYAGWTIDVTVTGQTAPSLGPDDVTSSLWEGGTISVRVHCDDTRFVAEQARSAPAAPQESAPQESAPQESAEPSL